MKTLKSIFDRVMAFLSILLCWPFLLILAILVKCSDGGPVFFRQARVGLDGRVFKIIKFRSMKLNSETSFITVSGEDRITPLGAVLRRYKLDELPQLWNVLTGDMSFVGPRPHVKGYAEMLSDSDKDLLSMRPGITGPDSLKYRNEEFLLMNVAEPVVYHDTVLYPDKVRIGLYYVRHYSFWMDLKIIFATIFNKKIYYNGEYI